MDSYLALGRWISSDLTVSRSPLDPTAQVLLTVFGAALVTALAGFIGAWLQGRREHMRWLRQERLAAYLTFLRFAHNTWDVVDDMETAAREISELNAEREALHGAMDATADGASADEILATQKLDERADVLQRSMQTVAERFEASRGSLVDVLTGFSLLGPARVAEASGELAISLTSGADVIHSKIEAIEYEMRRALKVR